MNEVGIDTENNSVNLFDDKGGVKKVFVTEVLGDQNNMGGFFEKRKVEAVVDQENKERSERKLHLVLKSVGLLHKDDFPLENSLASAAERYLGKWKLLKEAGIPTVSSMKLVDDETVAMGDMTWDGSKFFGKAENEMKVYGQGETVKRELTNMEKIFLSIDPEEIKQKTERILKLAWDSGIRLPLDDPYDLLVHPDGSWELVVIDLSDVRPRKSGETIDDLKEDEDFILEDIEKLKKHYQEISLQTK